MVARNDFENGQVIVRLNGTEKGRKTQHVRHTLLFIWIVLTGAAPNAMHLIARFAASLPKGLSKSFGKAARTHDNASHNQESQLLAAITYVAKTIGTEKVVAARLGRGLSR